MGPALAIAGWVLAATATLAVIGARRLLRLRLELVARASHELRGPLTATRLGLQLGKLSPQRLRALDLELERAALALDDLAGIVTPSPRLHRISTPLVGANVRWHRPGAHAAPARACERVDIRQLLRDSVEAWRPAAAAGGTEITLEWSGAPAFVVGERVRLAQAIGNLLANAIEHGGAPVVVRGRADGPELRLEVIDGGTGLPAPVPELVARSGRPRAARGRGMAIADSIVRRHGGGLASAPSERGARLVITLPVTSTGSASSRRPVG